MTTFCYSLISDMHVDFPQPKTPYDQLEQFVIVAGDTSNGLGGTKFLQKLKNKGFEVFAVDGNHEHYANLSQGRTQSETEDQFYHLIGQHNHMYVGELLIVGFNGWYPVTDGVAWSSYMNDHRNTTLSVSEVNDLAAEHAWHVDKLIKDHGGPAIVVTHTAPSEGTLNPHFEGHFSNEWYWNPHMGEVLRARADQILVWNHGHSHAPADRMVDGVRVVCNPRGYPGEVPDWCPQTVEVVW